MVTIAQMVFPFDKPVVFLNQLNSRYVLWAMFSKMLEYAQIIPWWGNLNILPFRRQKTEIRLKMRCLYIRKTCLTVLDM